MRRLRVATCQFSVEPDVARNRRAALGQIAAAAEEGADLVHFSECALSGYAGVDIASVDEIDWAALHAATREIMAAAKKHRMWVVLGSTHRLDDRTKPHNSLYVIDARGEIVDRYDKRFCTGTDGRKPTLDLCHYTPGDRAVTFKVKGVVCGLGICYDYRFPELFRQLKSLGVEVLLQSFHNARTSVVADQKYNIWRTIVPATMQCRAAENHFWVSANNSTTKPSRWGSFVVRPDGAIVGRLPVHRPGVLVTDMEIRSDYFDAPGPWREAAMGGTLHSGQLVAHPRTSDVTCLE